MSQSIAVQSGGHASPQVARIASIACGVLGFGVTALLLGAEVSYLLNKWTVPLDRVMWIGVSVAVTLGALALVQLCAAEWSRPGMRLNPLPKAGAALVLLGLTWWQVSGALAFNAAKTGSEGHAKTATFALAEKRVQAYDAELAKLDAQDAAIDPAAERAAAEERQRQDLARQDETKRQLRGQIITLNALVAATDDADKAAELRRSLRSLQAQLDGTQALTLEPAREAAERVKAQRAEIAERRAEVEQARAKVLPDYEKGVWTGKYERTEEHGVLAAIFLLIAELLVAVRGIAAETTKERQRRQEDEAKAIADAERAAASEQSKATWAKRTVFKAGLEINQTRILRARELLDAGLKVEEAAEVMAREAKPEAAPHKRGAGLDALLGVAPIN